jgi:hypothetical protein
VLKNNTIKIVKNESVHLMETVPILPLVEKAGKRGQHAPFD